MNQQILNLLRKPWFIPTSVGVVTFSGGAALGYILGRRRSQSEIQELGEVITEAIYDIQMDTEELEKATEDLRIKTVKLESVNLVPVDEENFSEVHVIKTEDVDKGWDYEVERNIRTKEEPYILHRDEFFNDEMGYTQSTVTYYQGDDILTDELDVPIYGHSAMVGDLRFGHGSGDPNVVYIRSEMLEHEYEVILNYGRYEVEILGLEIDEQYRNDDLKHSAIRKFKLD